MFAILQAPDWLLRAAPEGPVRDLLAGWGWYVVLGLAAFIVLLIVWSALRSLGPRRDPRSPTTQAKEDLTSFPPPPKGAGRLCYDGVPVRLRLIVVAPVGSRTDDEIDMDRLDELLERVISGIGQVIKEDRPRVKLWPTQVSQQGFATHFLGQMHTGEQRGDPSRWVLAAGRVKLKDLQFMLGLALLAARPTTLGERKLDAHQWGVLRVREA